MFRMDVEKLFLYTLFYLDFKGRNLDAEKFLLIEQCPGLSCRVGLKPLTIGKMRKHLTMELS